MRTVFLLCLFAICVDHFTADTDPWVTFFRQTLDERLKEASESWPDEANITNATFTLVERSDGWLSLRQGLLYNLSSWSLQQNVTLQCNTTTNTSNVTAIIAFQDLPFTFSYWFDNGTSLASPRDLAGTLRGLAAQLVFTVQTFPQYYYSTTNFHLQKQNTSVELTDFNPGNVAPWKSEVVTTVGRALGEDILTLVEQLVGKILEYTTSEVNIYAVSNTCTPPSTTTAPATATHTSATTETTKFTDTTTNATKETVTTTGTTGTTKAAAPTTRTTKETVSTTGTTKAAAPTTRTTERNAASSKTTETTAAIKKTPVNVTTKHVTSATTPPSNPEKEIMVDTAGKFIKLGSEDECDYEKQELSSHDKFGDSSSDTITVLNSIMTDMLQKAGKRFTAWDLLPYKMPNTENEIYQKAEGAGVANVTLKGLRNLAVSGDPDVERANKTARVSAYLVFSGVTYSAQLRLSSVDSEWKVEGDVDKLKGQLIVNVNYENVSAAKVSLESFEMEPFVLLTGTPKVVSSTARKHVDASEVEDAVRGVFKEDVIPMLLRVDNSTLLDSAIQGDTLDMHSLIVSQTTPASNPDKTSAPSTSPASAPSTTPSSATLPRSFQGRMMVLTSVVLMLLAAKMLV